MSDQGAGHDAPQQRQGKADRKHSREYIVLRGIVLFGEEPPMSVGLMDISVGGAKIKTEDYSPEVGAKVLLHVEAIKVRVHGVVVRVFSTPSGIEVAVKFHELNQDIPGRLLEYKLRSFGSGRLQFQGKKPSW